MNDTHRPPKGVGVATDLVSDTSLCFVRLSLPAINKRGRTTESLSNMIYLHLNLQLLPQQIPPQLSTARTLYPPRKKKSGPRWDGFRASGTVRRKKIEMQATF